MNDSQTDAPTPGSDEAIDRGCICPVLDNAHGQGIPRKDGPLFWITEDCPLHGYARHRKQEP